MSFFLFQICCFYWQTSLFLHHWTQCLHTSLSCCLRIIVFQRVNSCSLYSSFYRRVSHDLVCLSTAILLTTITRSCGPVEDAWSRYWRVCKIVENGVGWANKVVRNSSSQFLDPRPRRIQPQHSWPEHEAVPFHSVQTPACSPCHVLHAAVPSPEETHAQKGSWQIKNKNKNRSQNHFLLKGWQNTKPKPSLTLHAVVQEGWADLTVHMSSP